MSDSLISKKEAWLACQELQIGANRDAIVVHQDAQEIYREELKRCLVARPLNPKYQPLAGLRLSLPQKWKMEGRVEGRCNGDGTVSFFFKEEDGLHVVVGNAPYRYKGCMVSIDLGRNHFYPTYLRKIPFRIQILNLPDKYRRNNIIESIGSRFGWVYRDSIKFTDPGNGKSTEVWVKVDCDASDKITLARNVRVIDNDPPVFLGFRYEGLLKFCTSCGSLCHASVDCPTRLTPEEEENQDLHICQVTGYDDNLQNVMRVSTFLGYATVSQASEQDVLEAGVGGDNVTASQLRGIVVGQATNSRATLTPRNAKRKGPEYVELRDKHQVGRSIIISEPSSNNLLGDQGAGASAGLTSTP